MIRLKTEILYRLRVALPNYAEMPRTAIDLSSVGIGNAEFNLSVKAVIVNDECRRVGHDPDTDYTDRILVDHQDVLKFLTERFPD